MGECFSKEQDFDFSAKSDKNPTRVEDKSFSDIRVDSVIREDELNVEVLRREFRENPQVFLLNNLLMTIQFFENHQQDREQLLLSTNKMEKEINTTLLNNETMECIFPDATFEIINNNLKYRTLHGPKKYFSEPLVPRRLFIVNYTMEVISGMDIPQYTSIDKPAYQVRIEESNRKGFVRLKQIDTNKIPKVCFFNPDEAGPSGLQSPESDYYSYSTITDLHSPKLLDIEERLERRDTLPISCFTSRKVKKPDFEIQDLQENDNSELTVEDIFDTVIYVDAKGFMNYFKNVLFPNSLGRSLGFTQHDIDLAKSIPGKVFCNLTDGDDNPIPSEVIPSVAIEWPAEQTFEFIRREDRPTIIDKNTGIRYKWPTDQMIKEMLTFKCVVVPKGYWMKKGRYFDATIEWEIAFPKAERYLEARMSHAQIKCFLILLVLHRTFIEPATQQHGLLIEHIRCHMFWECEANFRDWPEHRLGTKILKIIENLSQRISKSELPDYFIKQKNHFRNIPKKYLQVAQKVFHEILQSPVIHFIKALRCMRYSSGKFYSPFDFKEFYRMLTQIQGFKLINPNLMNIPPNVRKKKYFDTETQLRHFKELERRQLFLAKRNKKKRNIEEEDTVSVDSIDLEWNMEKKMEIFKIKAILTQFIKSFIEIAKDVSRFGGTENQSLFYLKQASYLNRILEATSPAFLPEVREFRNEIYLEQEAVQKSAVLRISNKPPETPARNSIQFDFSMSQQLKSNLLNLGNLHNSYNGGGVKVLKQHQTQIVRAKSDVKKSSAFKNGLSNLPRKSVAFVDPKKKK